MVKKPARQTEPVNVHIGIRLRARRNDCSVTQQALAAHLGLSFQQIGKYEKGVDSMSALMLSRAGEFLQCSPGYFFEGYGKEAEAGITAAGGDNLGAMLTPRMVAFVKMVHGLPAAIFDSLFDLVRSIWMKR